MPEQPRPRRSRPKPRWSGTAAPPAAAATPPPTPAGPAGAPPPAVDLLTPEEQMERFAKELKNEDWGHQPC